MAADDSGGLLLTVRGWTRRRTTDLLEETWRSTIDVGRQLSADDWERATDCPGWTVKDHVLARHRHRAHAAGPARRRTASVGLGGPCEERRSGSSTSARWTSRRSMPGPDVLAELEELVDLGWTRCGTPTTAYFAQERMTPTGPGTMLDFLSIRILDCWVHEQDVRRAVDRPGHLSGGPAEHTVDRLLRTIPIVVGQAGGRARRVDQRAA